MRAKMKYICKKFINHQIKKCLLFRCRHAVVIMETLNWTNQCPLFVTVRHIFEISEDDHPRTVTHGRDNWWTLDSANAFGSPGVNSRGELVPSHGASRRRLGDYCNSNCNLIFLGHAIYMLDGVNSENMYDGVNSETFY
jgi:hypothetical protein